MCTWFEINRIIKDKKVRVFLVSLVFLSILTTYTGIINYKKYKEQKKAFIYYQQKDAQEYNNYSQYGSDGINLMVDINPLSILFKNSPPLESNISTNEKGEIYVSKRGKNYFTNNELVNFTFADIIYLFGFIVGYFGFTTFNKILKTYYYNGKYLFKTILMRMFIFNIIFVCIFFIPLLLIIINGINLNSTEIWLYIFFTIVSILYLSVFFLLGVIIVMFKNSNIMILNFAILLLVIIQPILFTKIIEVNSTEIIPHEYNKVKKLKILMDYEREAEKIFIERKKQGVLDTKIKRELISIYLNQTLKKNNEIENEYIKKEYKMVEKKKLLLKYSIAALYQYILSEISGNSDDTYFEFLEYTKEKRKKFIAYILNKRHMTNEKTVKTFCPAELNMYKPKSIINGDLLIGIKNIAIYDLCCIFMIFIMYNLKKLKKKKRVSSCNGVYFRCSGFLEEIRMAEKEADTIILNGFESTNRINKKLLLKHLENIRKAKVNYNIKDTDEEIKKIVLWVFLNDVKIKKIVLIEYFKGLNYNDENEMRMMINKFKQNKVILYLTNNFPEAVYKKNFKDEMLEKNGCVEIDITKYSFR